MIELKGRLVDLVERSIYGGLVRIEAGRISEIVRDDSVSGPHIMPGLIDAHVHIESSLLVPSEFARLAVRHGTVATVSDPHEIANVLGVAGIRFMLENAETVPLKFNFGAPSCVPATVFETAGGVVTPADVHELLRDPRIKYLAEMMNYPGVLMQDPAVMEKLAAAREQGKPIDGHSPGLRGGDAERYCEAGISTDHECFSLEEALDKIAFGMQILIREGSAARNFEALVKLLDQHPRQVMFCTDDLHPDLLVEGHINRLVRRGLSLGYDLFDVLCAATENPVRHYGLDVGLLRLGDPGDLIVVEDLETFEPSAVYIDGEQVFSEGGVHFPTGPVVPLNKFVAEPLSLSDVELRTDSNEARVIQVVPGELITKSETRSVSTKEGLVDLSEQQDIQKLVVVNRYEQSPPAIALVSKFGLERGALASSVAHDCHNIIAVGANDVDLVAAINLVIEHKGGLAAVSGDEQEILSLPVAGLMSDADGESVAKAYKQLDRLGKQYGSPLPAPFMTLSFLALLVIPELKLSDKGLFDGKRFEFVELFAQSR